MEDRLAYWCVIESRRGGGGGERKYVFVCQWERLFSVIQGDFVCAPKLECFVSCPWAGLQFLLDSLRGPVWFFDAVELIRTFSPASTAALFCQTHKIWSLSLKENVLMLDVFYRWYTDIKIHSCDYWNVGGLGSGMLILVGFWRSDWFSSSGSLMSGNGMCFSQCVFLSRRCTERSERTRTWRRTLFSAWLSWPQCMVPSSPMKALRWPTWPTWWRDCSTWSMGAFLWDCQSCAALHACSSCHSNNQMSYF